jgi:hypothetical protein
MVFPVYSCNWIFYILVTVTFRTFAENMTMTHIKVNGNYGTWKGKCPKYVFKFVL